MGDFSLLVLLLLASHGDSDTDSELEDRVDGVKSWLSKNKGSAKNLSDDGSLKSSRSVEKYLLGLSCLAIIGQSPDECDNCGPSGCSLFIQVVRTFTEPEEIKLSRTLS